MRENKITVVGAGLAGCEAAMQIANSGYPVTLIEQKPLHKSPAHHMDTFAELVCSNSLGAIRKESALGLLKEEMRLLGSVCVDAANSCSVDAGGALAVDRDKYSLAITKIINQHPLIKVKHEIFEKPHEGYTIIATGPLTENALADEVSKICGGMLSFFDAAAPIVTFDSIDMSHAFAASRYDRGEAAYINCPMNKEAYEEFHAQLINAQSAPQKDFDKRLLYEGCMPIELMAKRGEETIRFGPLKPVGLRDPKTGHRPWAVVQLRKENEEGSLYNLVGFQTSLKFSEQKRVFSMIPALKNAEFVRYGVMHRNTFIDSPRLLNPDFSLKSNSKIFFAGQITGVEGYMPSAASGILAGINLVRRIKNQSSFILPSTTMLGALTNYITDDTVENFQPMGANFGILPKLSLHIKDKKLRYSALAERALTDMNSLIQLKSERTVTANEGNC